MLSHELLWQRDNGPSKRTSAGALFLSLTFTALRRSRPSGNVQLARPPGNVSRDPLHPLACVTSADLLKTALQKESKGKNEKDKEREYKRAKAVASLSKVLPVSVARAGEAPVPFSGWSSVLACRSVFRDGLMCSKSLARPSFSLKQKPSRRKPRVQVEAAINLVLLSTCNVKLELRLIADLLPLAHCYLARCLVIYHDQCQVELLHCTAECNPNLIIHIIFEKSDVPKRCTDIGPIETHKHNYWWCNARL